MYYVSVVLQVVFIVVCRVCICEQGTSKCTEVLVFKDLCMWGFLMCILIDMFKYVV